MNTRTILIAITSVMGTQVLGFPILYGLLAFNLVIWADIVYNLAFSAKIKAQTNISPETPSKSANDAQIAFERWIIKKYVELSKAEEELPIEEIPAYFSNNLAAAEA